MSCNASRLTSSAEWEKFLKLINKAAPMIEREGFPKVFIKTYVAALSFA